MTKIDDIISLVCASQGVTRDEILNIRCRKQRIARARQMAMTLAREFMGSTLTEVGQMFCRDHSTVSHAITNIGVLETKKPHIADQMAAFRAALRPAPTASQTVADAQPQAAP